MTYRRAISELNPALYSVFSFRHILHLVIDKAAQWSEEMAYKVYCTDALMAISKGVGRMAGVQSMGMRFVDVLEKAKHPDNRTGAEIRRDMLAKMREDWGEDDGELA